MDYDSSWEAHSITEEVLTPSSDIELNWTAIRVRSALLKMMTSIRINQPRECMGLYHVDEPVAQVMPADHRCQDEDVRDSEKQNRLYNTHW